ncbi:hypothetical protein D4764_14G0010020 [Takifugu flavidus]|uniref:G-protein coupled receptors family 1 profile domain-containing protein n=1 Tax=Takifugu flavidus TaxID=433684 RepID=A0A5C6P7V9_9TELE|nr:hypothetical protein D4764_14G0010020 [Takifugu flavidus]
MFLLRTVSNVSIIIHPPGFYVVGFETFPHIRFYFIFLAFVYVVTVFFNCLLIYVIVSNRCLHTPKFLAVVNLAVIDIVLNSTTIPSMIRTVFALAILAYDRLIAICPLQQNSINTLRSMSCIVACRYFCDSAPTFRLACNDYTLHWAVASTEPS